MAHQPSPELEHHQEVQLFKSMPLGAGSYGVVCEAMCDELPCAAKLLHPILFQFNDPGAPDYAKKFEQECRLFSEMKHPHIVQHLGTTTDPDTGLPVILMELMDESLTQFLNRCKQPLLYHIEVNLCHNIALALAYLHSKDLIHRDLSSNNILLIGSNRAKIADFGMSSLAERMKSLTRCPGATVYMPPEAFQDPPVYSKKLDCFSFGVLNIQIMTRQHPEPGPAEQLIDDPRSPVGRLKIPIPESIRRKSHIDLVRPDHPVLSLALSCLSYKEEDRPSAQDLCLRLAALKEDLLYTDSMQQTPDGVEPAHNGNESQLTELQEQSERQAQLIRELQEKLVGELQLKEKIEAANEKIAQVVGETETKLQQLNTQLQERGETVTQLQQELTQKAQAVGNLQDSLSAKEKEIEEVQQRIADRNKPQAEGSTCSEAAIISLSWGECAKAPEKMARGSAVLDGKIAYFNPGGSSHVHGFDSETESWYRLPDCPCYTDFSLAVVNRKLTAVGGFQGWWANEPTNTLLSLVENGEKKWEKLFPPMPTKRHSTSAVCSGRHLIVIGGMIYQQSLRTIEVMDADTLEWFAADRLSRPLSGASVTLCGDMLYLTGGGNYPGDDSLVELRLSDLLQSCQTEPPARSTVRTVWQRTTHAQVSQSTCATLCDRLIAIGGKDSDDKDSPIVQSYDPVTGSWQVLSVLSTARARPLVVTLPNNRLMVVGGAGSKFNVGFLSLTYRITEIAHAL